MKEEIIQFFTAKLAKEKGFDIPSSSPYNNKGELCNSGSYLKSDFIKDRPFELTHAPTQSLLQRWLRETHNVHVVVDTEYRKVDVKPQYYFSVEDLHGNELGIPQEIAESFEYKTSYDTYEKALEIGLLIALKLIKT